MMRLKTAATVLGMGLGIAALAGPANAALVLSYQVGAGPATSCADGAACDSNGVAGAITVLAAADGYSFFVETVQSYPATGSPSEPVLRMNVTGTTSSGAGDALPLTLMATQTGFTASGLTAFDLGSTISFPAGSDTRGAQATADYAYYLDNGNTEFGTSTTLGTTGFAFTGPGTSDQSSNNAATGLPDGGFSLTSVLVLAGVDRGKDFSATATISGTAIPEPASLAVLGMGLLGLGLTRRVRGRRAA